MEHIRESIRLFRANPRLFRYVVAPMGWSLLLFLAIVFLGYLLLVPLLRLALTSLIGEWASTVGTLLYFLAWLFISGIVFLGIASFLSSMMWDRLSGEIETLATGSAPSVSLPRATILADSANRTILTLALGFFALCGGFLMPVILPLVIAGFVGTMDFTASAFARRGMLMRDQRKRLFKLKGWPSFYVAAAVLTLMPFVNVLMLPLMVGAGTIMVAKSRLEA